MKQVAEEAGDPVVSKSLGRVVPAHLEQSFAQIVPSARPPWGTRVEKWSLVEQIGQKMMDRVLMQGEDVETALREAAIEIDEELARD